MPVIQVEMEVPEEIYKRITSGDFIRYGGVVRDHAGRIVKHLSEIDVFTNEHTRLAKTVGPSNGFSGIAKIKELVSEHKVASAGVGIAAASGIAYLAYKAIKSGQEKETTAISLSDNSFDEAWKNYIESLNSMRLDEAVLDKLRSIVDDIIDCIIDSNRNNTLISIDEKQFNTILTIVYDYTLKLAAINNVQIEDIPQPNFNSESSAFIKLSKYLDAQKEIFEKAS